MAKVRSFVIISIAVIILVITSSLFSSHIGRVIGPIKSQEFGINQVSQILTLLTLVALFFERALEVFVLTFRKLDEQKYELELRSFGTPENQKKLDNYKDETRKITLWAALLGGVLISMVGVRGLESFVTLTSNTNNWQLSLFRILDILLTGTVIAGGSDAIHKILQVFTTFMDAVAISNKAQAATIQDQAVPTIALK